MRPINPPCCPHCTRPIAMCQCGKAPARTFVKRGFYMCCTACGLAVEWCKCGALPVAEAPPEDGPAAASLAARIAEVKGIV